MLTIAVGAGDAAKIMGKFIRPISALAATGLAAIVTGTVFSHLAHTPVAQGLPAFLVLILAGFIAGRDTSRNF